MIMDECYAAYINLDHREDRRQHMTRELRRIGLNAYRFPAIPTSYGQTEIPYPVEKIRTMLNRTPGAIGCHYSQVGVMSNAQYFQRHAMVMEDDLIFCKDFWKRMQHIDAFLKTHEWDVFWLGGTFHVNPAVWHTGAHPQLRGSFVGRDVECTEDPRIVRTYGAFSTYCYIVNQQSLGNVLHLLDKYVSQSIGIDWLFIKIQPLLKTYAFVPGCVKQLDNQSDIGNGMTYFSHFSSLGPYWYADYMEDFDPSAFNWAEANLK